MEYVLRVYDDDGRFDETLPLPINVASMISPPMTMAKKQQLRAMPKTARPCAISMSQVVPSLSMAAMFPADHTVTDGRRTCAC